MSALQKMGPTHIIRAIMMVPPMVNVRPTAVGSRDIELTAPAAKRAAPPATIDEGLTPIQLFGQTASVVELIGH